MTTDNDESTDMTDHQERQSKVEGKLDADATAARAPDTPASPSATNDPEAALGSQHTMASYGVESSPPAATIPAPPLPVVSNAGTLVGGKYELVRLIAEGGMGKVFLAQHRALRMRVAVKIMHDHIAMNPEHVERFRREALAASRLAHPNIVKVLDFGSLRETFYIVMEYVEGQSLGKWLDARTDVPALAEVSPILLQTLDALIEAHGAGIVHRDLKPDNILLTQDAQGAAWVKIVDFGLARFRDPSANEATITQADAVAGTPAYMSPEQCRSLKVTHSTDLYAYGCIMTELLQLEPLFTGDSVMEVISKHMFAPVPPLERPPGADALPPQLDRLRRDLLAKLPSQRPADARVVRTRLLAALGSDAAEGEFVRKSQLASGDRAARNPAWNAEVPTTPGVIAASPGVVPTSLGVGPISPNAIAASSGVIAASSSVIAASPVAIAASPGVVPTSLGVGPISPNVEPTALGVEPPPPGAAPSPAVRVEYRPLVDSARVVDALCLVGLSSLGFDVRAESATSGSPESCILPQDDRTIYVLDAGADAQLAISNLKALRATAPTAKFVVCLTDVNTTIIAALIEAGADDVVRGPTSSDVLARKLSRLKRTG